MDFSTVPAATSPAGFSALGFIAGAWRTLTAALLTGYAFHKVMVHNAAVTLNATDHPPGTLLRMTNGSAVNITVPQDSSYDFPIGGRLRIFRTITGAGGQITVVAGSGNTVVFGGTNRDNLAGQYAVGELIKLAANEWVFTGDTSTT